ncbi:MAG TPA: non-canonical purine NTP diphosphatase [Bacteroidia bacterium]
MQLVFATNNLHKLQEVQALLHTNIRLISLTEIGCTEDLSETGNTLVANAKQKAIYIRKKYDVKCFADDTGLEIEALGGNPGVLSARYAGEEKNSEKNIEKILGQMKNITHRNASFKTVIALILGKKEFLFEGRIDGIILKEKRGENGFGYDPIFQPLGSTKTFAEMSMEEKNKISHRAIAIKKLAEFLNSTNL